MRPRVEVYLCYVDLPELSTYRHISAAISRCVFKGVYDLENMPADIAEKILKRGELLLTELSAEMSHLIGVDHLGDYQYLRIVLQRS